MKDACVRGGRGVVISNRSSSSSSSSNLHAALILLRLSQQIPVPSKTNENEGQNCNRQLQGHISSYNDIGCECVWHAAQQQGGGVSGTGVTRDSRRVCDMYCTCALCVRGEMRVCS
jgi:hypothetical protein